ncbi:hypothetical protein E8E15_000382 [Penicillium rubens]|uniref:Pc18g02950 protein n=2 Tax=Penicillium chrysogenum species complex TaxID=254878 RepID=B6HB64_PENRW|nr:uncharacterized protein N7525_000696 [Penicillium rubens]XP_056566036.1 uncharacterized protein N7489_006571 [Penicillium chrysogenum]CAP94519.1 Pc18g02950 [Penicillium rubens Wisconsin 54-1255]KAF3012886.1 hypothetical protein E8E15_000382 [Penicillium rubens]KAJ5039581.1 hypothetical protein NUH16_009364 [Penicillium rubens]KAJ5236480.1 hypothetical protein N7489_006571 [Penicillium chrysogenum]KAJ5255384.1 hypothetical protein N7505_010535 [Penicillium chrysogenum]
MSDTIPSASAGQDTVENAIPSNAEDRKAAAALSSLNTNEIATEGASAGAPLTVNQEALGRAMSRLEIAAGQDSGNKKTAEGPKTDEVLKKKTVKVAPADVTLLVDHLDLSKTKATDLLKAHDGDVTQAMKAFIAPSMRV